MLSALAHDLEHPGTTNAYQINAQTELALLHNDYHVLARYQCIVLCCRALRLCFPHGATGSGGVGGGCAPSASLLAVVALLNGCDRSAVP